MRKISRLKLKIFFSFFGIVMVFALIIPVITLLSVQTELDAMNIVMPFPVRSFAFVSILAAVLGVTLGLFSTNKIVKPIIELSLNAKKIANGDFNVKTNKYTKNDELADFVDAFNHMAEKLSKNEYLHKDFVSNVSHEFKTPVSSIMGYSEMLSVPDLSDEKRIKYAEVITRQADNLSKLSSNMLRLSELESDEKKISKSKFSVDEQIREAIFSLQNEWEEKELEIELDENNTSVVADKALLNQVWLNILSNAIKYSKTRGKLTINIEQSDDTTITIKDTGTGMTKEQVNRVFERFYKGDSSRSTKGTGLGLAITKKIIELHGGTIKIESSENVGTAVVVIVPNDMEV